VVHRLHRSETAGSAPTAPAAPSPVTPSQTLRTRVVFPMPASPWTSTARGEPSRPARTTSSNLDPFAGAAGQRLRKGSRSHDIECDPAEPRLSSHFPC
jgi:hypothetical protein